MEAMSNHSSPTQFIYIMYYVIELTCIGPKIKEVFKSKELAAQYTIALHKNYPDKHYQIAKAELDMDGIE